MVAAGTANPSRYPLMRRRRLTEGNPSNLNGNKLDSFSLLINFV